MKKLLSACHLATNTNDYGRANITIGKVYDKKCTLPKTGRIWLILMSTESWIHLQTCMGTSTFPVVLIYNYQGSITYVSAWTIVAQQCTYKVKMVVLYHEKDLDGNLWYTVADMKNCYHQTVFYLKYKKKIILSRK